MRTAAVVLIGAVVAACVSIAPAASPSPAPVQTASPQAMPAASTAAGPVAFGKVVDRTDCSVSPVQSTFNVGENLAWAATFSEPAGATTIHMIFVRVTSGGGELVVQTMDEQVGSPTWNLMCTDSADMTTYLGPGTYVLRYTRGLTVLAQGTFTVKEPLPSPSPVPTPTPSPSATPSPRPTPTPSPNPTFRPSSVSVSDATYSPDSCWKANNWIDSDGHSLSGYVVKLEITLVNDGRVDSPAVWFRVQDLTDWFEFDPYLVGHGWTEPGYSTFWHGQREIEVVGPPVEAGKTRTYKFSVLYQTVFDAHYDIAIAYGPPGYEPSPANYVTHWTDLWTSNRVCF